MSKAVVTSTLPCHQLSEPPSWGTRSLRGSTPVPSSLKCQCHRSFRASPALLCLIPLLDAGKATSVLSKDPPGAQLEHGREPMSPQGSAVDQLVVREGPGRDTQEACMASEKINYHTKQGAKRL